MQLTRKHHISIVGFALLLAIFAVMFLHIRSSWAVVRTWDGGGVTNNWSEDANWSGDVEPGASDIATFNGTSTKDVTIDTAINVQGIDVNTGYTGTITQGAGNTVTVGNGNFDISAGSFVGSDSTVDINGTFSVTGGSYTSTTGTMSVTGAFTVSSGTFEPATGTVVADGATATWNVVTTETFYNLTFAKTTNAPVNISSGDTLVVSNLLTLTDGVVQTGTVDARGDISIGAAYDGGTATVDFGNDALVQTMTVNGGTTPVIRLDDPDDASDEIDIAAASTFASFSTTAGFSGAIPLNNPTDYTLTFNTWSQLAGTYDASAQSSWNINTFTRTGGSFIAPVLVTMIGGTSTWNVDVTQTVNNLEVSKSAVALGTISSGDTIVVLGDLTLTEGQVGTGTLAVHGDIIQAATFDGGSAIIDFSDDATVQTYNIGGGIGPNVRFDDPDDANDSVNLNATATITGLLATAGFAGVIPFNNPSNFTPTFTTWSQLAGTYDASAQTAWNMNIFTRTGGTFIAPALITVIGGVTNWDVDVTQAVNNLTINKSSGASVTLPSGDTVEVLGDLLLTDGLIGTGTFAVHGDITLAATFDGGTATIDFSDDAAVQVFNINGGVVPNFRFDDPDDANDDVNLVTNPTTIVGVTTTAGFSGAIPFNNPSNFTPQISRWSQAGGTYDASAQSAWNVVDFDRTGGTFTAPTLFTSNLGSENWDIDVSQEFNNFTVNKLHGANLILSASDTLIINGTLTLTEGGLNTGIVDMRGDGSVASTFDVASVVIDFGNDAAVQELVINGVNAPRVRFDDTDDANDIVTINSATTFYELITTADFPGTVELSNPSDFVLSFFELTLDGGTVDASGDSEWKIRGLTATNGNFTAPALITAYESEDTWNVNTTLSVNNLTVNKLANTSAVVIPISDTIVVNGDLVLTNGQISTGTISVMGDITVDATFDAGTGTVDFGNDAVVQTFSINGPLVPQIRFDDPDDANDELDINVTTYIEELITTADFSGTVPLNNPSDFVITLTDLTLGGGTLDASAQSSWFILRLTRTSGIFLPPVLVNVYGAQVTWDINGTQTFQNVTVNRTADTSGFNPASGDVVSVTGTLTLVNGRLEGPGIIEAQGDLVVQSTWDAGPGPLQFGGSANQTFDLTTNTGVFDGDIQVIKTGGRVSMITDLVMNGTNQDLIIAEGVFDLNGRALTVNGTSGTLTVQDGGIFEWGGFETLTLNGGQPTLQSGSTVRFTGDGDSASDTYTVTTLSNAYHHLDIASVDAADTYQLGAALDLGGDLTIATGTFTVTGSNHQINIAGNWSNSGTFQANSGSVVFDGASQSISGTNTFNNFTKSVATAATLTLPASTTQTFNGALALSGASGQRLSLRSSSPGVQASIDPNTATASYLDIQDNNNVSGSDITCTGNCFDSGNNDGWIFPGVVVSIISANTTEVGGTGTFSIVLNTLPTDTVTIPLSSSDTTEGTIAVTEAVFTVGNWSTPQVFTVTGVNDSIDDGDVAYSIVTGTVTSTDPAFSGSEPDDVAVTNIDNDTAGVIVSAVSGNTTEAGGTATYTVVLTSEPAVGSVRITNVTTDATEGVVTGGSTLTFTNVNWNTPQTVTITGQDDGIVDGDVSYGITVSMDTGFTTDPLYDAIDPTDASLQNEDDDTPGVSVAESGGSTTVNESGTTDTYTLVLGTQPLNDVIVTITTDAEVDTDVPTVTFTNLNWSTPQTVTVSAVNDSIDENNEVSVITHASESDDPAYDSLTIDSVSVTVGDNDTRGVTVSAISNNTSEAGATATFTVVLNTEPTGNVVVDSVSSDATEGVVTDGAELTFTTVNWATPQTVTVTGQDDSLADGDILYSIITTTDDTLTLDNGYDAVNPSDVSVTNDDDGDAAGVVVSAISGNTSEGGSTATFTVVLTAQPSGDVVIDSASNDATEGVVTGGSELTFTDLNWDTPQTVTVTGQNDDLDDGNIAYTILVTMDTVGTQDAAYDAVEPNDVSVTNTDNDASTATSSAISNNTSEAGATATFTIVLNAEPTGDVVIDSVSSDATEGIVTDGAELTFTSLNWDTPQTVTVTGQDDALADGNIVYSIIVTVDAENTDDPNFDGANPNDVSVTNTDDGDSVGVTVSAINQNTSEAGATGTFTLVLTSEPTGNVEIDSVSSDATEGVVTLGATRTFTPLNWSTPQTVVVTGQDDELDDGNIAYSIVVSIDAGNTADDNYDAYNPGDVSVTNTDNDTSGAVVTAITNNTTEAGATATFTIALTAEPTGDVVIDSVTDDATEGVVTANSTVTFTSLNWNSPQTVTVTGQDDEIADGNVGYNIVVTVDQDETMDANYDAVNPNDVPVINEDDGDALGVTVSAISGNTTEVGGTATFTVVLDSEPTGNVVVDSVTADATEGVVTGGAELTFTAVNWATPQTVTITGQDDAIDDGNIDYTITVSVDTANTMDGNYDAVDPDDVSVTNIDNDTAGVTVSAISGNTTEAGGTATFTVVLTSEPTGNVVIDSASNDATEGVVTGGGELTFTNLNWSTPQTVTVTGQDDSSPDGNVVYSIEVTTDTVSTLDPLYDAINPNDVSVTNEDDGDTVGITVSAISGNTTEASGTATFTVVLTAEPTGNVVIDSASNDATEGVVTGGAELTFTTVNWTTPQTVTVTGQNDAVDDGDIAYTILVTTDVANTVDPAYDAINPGDVSVTNTDNDTVGITVSAISGNSTEAGGTATFTVVLDSEPTGDVVIDAVTDDATEGVVTGGAELTFTSGNWSTPQTVTVTGQNDAVDDGDIAYDILVTVNTVDTLDPLYDALNPDDVSVTNTDNDTAGVTVSAISGNTTEAGGTATFTVVLDSEPTGNVVIDSASDDSTEGVVTGGAELTFTTVNWATPQTVTVTGQDDVDADGDVAYTIVVTVDTGNTADAAYDAINPNDVSVTNEDDADGVGISVSLISGNTTEAGGTATFTVVLESEPAGNVVIDSASNDSTEGMVTGGAELTFTTINWDTPQTVTVTGQNDAVDDGDVIYTIIVAIDEANTLDPEYDVVNPDDVTVTNTDNDAAGVTVSTISGNTTELGGTATFTVVLDSEPTGNVVIDSASDDATEGVVTGGAELTFTTGNWSTPQTVTITGQDDSVADGDILYSILVTIDTVNTLDATYDAIDPADVAVTNADSGDSVGVTVSAISGNTTEAGGTATYTVVLLTEPTADVVITNASADSTEGIVTIGATLTFTTLNWATPQTVTVTGQDDALADGNASYSITVAVDGTATLDNTYDLVDPNDVSVVNEDDETATITVTESDGSSAVTEGGATDTFEIVLEAEPTADVTIFITDDAQVTSDLDSLTFTALNWSTPQTVTLTAVDDATDETDPHFGSIVFAVDSLDIGFDGYLLTSLDVAITDNDAPESSRGSVITFVKNATMEIIPDLSRCDDRNMVSLLIKGEGIREVLVGNEESLVDAQWQAIGPGIGSVQIELPWTLAGETGEQMVFARFRSNSGNVTVTYNAAIDLGEVPGTCVIEEVGDEVDEIFAHLPIMGLSPYDNVTWEPVARVFDGELIVGEHYDTVYLIEDGKRRPFFDEQTYFTWYTDFKWVRLVTDATLPYYPLGEPMLPKAGTVMVKLEGSPEVFVTLPQNPDALRRLTSETQAQQIAGPAWSAFVVDLSPSVYPLYETGADLRSTEYLDRTKMYIRHGLQAYDQDRDGVLDVDEAIIGTDPTSNDSDSDGYPDGIEVINGYDPLGFGAIDYASDDMDNDGLTNAFEIQMGTDPENADTDGDGYPDGVELMNGYSPLVPSS